jgi:hypothetical protein
LLLTSCKTINSPEEDTYLSIYDNEGTWETNEASSNDQRVVIKGSSKLAAIKMIDKSYNLLDQDLMDDNK